MTPHLLHECDAAQPIRDVWFVSSEIYRQTGYRGNHPLAIPRIGTVLTLCEQLGWLNPEGPGAYVTSPQATESQLREFHHQNYIDAVKQADERLSASPARHAAFGLGGMENPVFEGMYQRASTAVGGSILAGQLAARGAVAYHPSGGTHHAMPARASGFCYFNDPVFAILSLLQQGASRVAYVDLDAHHGDGVEAAFVDDLRVLTFSVHEQDRWPGTGRLDDRGRGNTFNLPVPPGLNDSEFDFLLQHALLPVLRGFEPEAVVLTCGADALAGDPLSTMALSNRCLVDAVMRLIDTAPAAVVLGGGGYNPWTLARYWTALWGRIAGHAMPDHLPAACVDTLTALHCDLIDTDEVNPDWLNTLLDARHDGTVRDEVQRDVASLMASIDMAWRLRANTNAPDVLARNAPHV
ncbi:MAG: acetoin utilization protein AcuC [Lysobacteraceae bacterium]